MKPLGNISGRTINLRLLGTGMPDLAATVGDVERLRLWRNQYSIGRYFGDQGPILPAQHAQWAERYFADDTDVAWVIERCKAIHGVTSWSSAATNVPVGAISLYAIDLVAGKAELGRMMIGDIVAQGKGYATEAVRLVCAAATSIGIREIRLDVMPDNTRAMGVYGACGFGVTGNRGALLRMVRKA